MISIKCLFWRQGYSHPLTPVSFYITPLMISNKCLFLSLPSLKNFQKVLLFIIFHHDHLPFLVMWSHQLSEKPLQFLFILFAWHDPRLWLSSLLTAGCYKRANDDQEVTNKPSVYNRVLARPPHVPPFRNFPVCDFT